MEIKGFDFEAKRKVFHLLALAFPLLYLYTSKLTIVSILVIISIFTLYIDMYRHYNATIGELVTKFFTQIMRPHEINGTSKLTGSSFMMLGFLFSALLFSKNLVICSWWVLIISDCLAALVGAKIGTPINHNKSLAGSSAFLVSAIFVSIISYFYLGFNTSFGIIVLSSVATTVAEFFAKDLAIDDNFLIPITYCSTTVILSQIIINM